MPKTPIHSTVIRKIQELGFDVYMRKEDKDTWLHYTDGTNIGYMQKEDIGGYSISSVHKANANTGTGFRIKEYVVSIDREALLSGFTHAANGFSTSDYKSVKKFKDINEFLKSSSWNGLHKLVPLK